MKQAPPNLTYEIDAKSSNSKVEESQGSSRLLAGKCSVKRTNSTVISQMWQLPLHFQAAPNIFTII